MRVSRLDTHCLNSSIPERDKAFSLLFGLQNWSGSKRTLIKWTPGDHSSAVKLLVGKPFYSSPSSAEADNVGTIIPLPRTFSLLVRI